MLRTCYLLFFIALKKFYLLCFFLPQTLTYSALFLQYNNLTMTIKRADVLSSFGESDSIIGEHRVFSVQFYTKKGELVFMQKARPCGLRMNMRENRMRGVQMVDNAGCSIGHVYPVCIDNVREFNGLRVKI